MTNRTPLITRWNASHDKSIQVFNQEDFDSECLCDLDSFSAEVFTTNRLVASVFSAEEYPDTYEEHEIVLKEIEARKRGDRVFYLHFGEHSCFSFRITMSRPKRSWDCGCVGILVVHRDHWPLKYWVNSFVYRKIDEAFSERVSATLNGWFYEAVITTDDGKSCYGGYLSEEEALTDAQRDFPDIQFKESDFVVETSYRLAA